jgi:ATPase family associated with various cellular activities (AAA)
MFSSLDEVGTRLTSTGYIADSIATTTVFLAARLHKPLLLEGPAGSGKTQLAYAVADAANTTVERLQCYEGINEEKAIGRFDESLQRLCVELRSKSAAADWELLQAELHGQQFFSAGPLLRALQFEKPCVLLIDELDKVDHAFEAQAFKRACSCFGLGRCLYHFTGTWVDLDERKRPKNIPQLFGWATPQGWREGLPANWKRIRRSSALLASDVPRFWSRARRNSSFPGLVGAWRVKRSVFRLKLVRSAGGFESRGPLPASQLVFRITHL